MKDIAKEADKYYERNKEHQQTFKIDLFQEHMHTLPLKGARVLEVGCATGFRLHDLATRGAVCFGIDPSPKAIYEGLATYTDISLTEGTADKLPYADGAFDIVYINVVLYTIPRTLLLRTVAEIDRVLTDGGRLVIADFFPDTPHRRTDRHAPGTYNYKQLFWEMFTSTNIYTIREKITYTFGTWQRNDTLTGGDDDCIIVDMEKNLEKNYPTRDRI